VRAVIDAAIKSDDAAAIGAVVRFTKQSNPEVAGQIDQIYAGWSARMAEKKAREEQERRERLAAARFFQYWRGEIEIGASRSTGNTENLGIYGAVRFDREGINWRHKIIGRTDVQETSGVTTTERVTASWQPNYKFDDRLYAYGLGQYEHDQFLGYANRYTGGGGLGYRLVAGSKLILDLEGGPVLRQTDFIDEPNETTIAGRASLSMRWKVTPTLQLSQDAAVYVEQGNNNATSTTALDTRLLGALKARFSYNLQYERDTPAGRESLDTLSRATIVYSF
jgi:putative salt-induced outer membrane protein